MHQDETGIEMEALTAVAIAALTVYDMCKAVDEGMVLRDIRLRSRKREEELAEMPTIPLKGEFG